MTQAKDTTELGELLGDAPSHEGSGDGSGDSFGNGSEDSGSNAPEWTVSEISHKLKKTVEDAYGHIRVRGEISRPTKPGSGHLYFTLKDDRNTLSAVCWRGVAQKLSVTVEEGMEVICTGRLTTYGPRSNYQLIVEDVRLAGVGALLQLIEERRKRLASEGLFDSNRKQELPFLPRRIGVVTSPTGAVIRDILHRIEERCPCEIILCPVRVQGQEAAAEITAALAALNKLGAQSPAPDVIIVARGGGSVEDLAAFNEEDVVRAVADSKIPVISAVGHETDTTLIDFASDLRAPTPTAAAEYAVPVRGELQLRIGEAKRRMTSAIQRRATDNGAACTQLGERLGNPERLVEMPSQRLDHLSERHDRALGMGLERLEIRLTHMSERLSPARLAQAASSLEVRLSDQAQRLDSTLREYISRLENRIRAAADLLESLSYKNVLTRGFALIQKPEGVLISSRKSLAPEEEISIRFHDGEISAVTQDGAQPHKRAKGKPSKVESAPGALLSFMEDDAE